jgi:hypothetical protein
MWEDFHIPPRQCRFFFSARVIYYIPQRECVFATRRYDGAVGSMKKFLPMKRYSRGRIGSVEILSIFHRRQ